MWQKFISNKVSPRICQHLECHLKGTTHVLWFAALEGTPCDFESVYKNMLINTSKLISLIFALNLKNFILLTGLLNGKLCKSTIW